MSALATQNCSLHVPDESPHHAQSNMASQVLACELAVLEGLVALLHITDLQNPQA